MNPLYTETEFNTAKSRDKLPFRCPHCGNTFLKPKNLIQRFVKGANPVKSGKKMFCSKLCTSRHRNPPVTIACEQCGKPFNKKASEVKHTKHHFCNQSCAAKYTNAHKTQGTRVSKLEKWLAEQLVTIYPDLEFHFNRKDAINGELDIYVPSLKLAFELNGIFHYEPIYGPDKLASIQTNDHRKMQACYEHGIELCIIDVSGMDYFKKTKAQKFLDITITLIRSKLSRISQLSPLSSQNHEEVP